MVWASCLLRWPTLSGVCFSLNKSISYLKKIRTSLVVQRLRLQASTEGSMGLIPVGELRSHKLSGTAKKKKNRNKNKIILINQWAIAIMF